MDGLLMKLARNLLEFAWMAFSRYIEHPANPKKLWTDGTD